MTETEAIAAYNQMAEKYNFVMALYDLCDCSKKPSPSYSGKARIPLINPIATESHKALMIFREWRNMNDYSPGSYLIELIEDRCKELEDISVKLHGPDDAYHENGYVQLYTDIDRDPDTGDPIVDPTTGRFIDHPNGTTIAFVDNVCADLDILDPAPDSSEFFESKVYPILNTSNASNIDTAVSAAIDVFDEVAALPKRGVLYTDGYSIGLELEYKYQYWVSDPQPDNPNYGYFVWHSKNDYTTKLKEIYPKVIACMRTDYDNWVNGVASTLQADLADLMNDYTVISPHSQYVYEEELTIAFPGTYTIAEPWWTTIPGPPSNADYTPTPVRPSREHVSVEYYYVKPAIRYDMVSWMSGIPPTNPRDVTDDNGACSAAYLGPITFKVARLENRYSNSDVHCDGFSYNWACGEISWHSHQENLYPDIPNTLVDIKAETYNDLNHLTSLTKTTYQNTINPCDSYICGSGCIDSLSAFPTISFDYDMYLYVPAEQYYTPGYVYNGVPYPHHYLAFTPVCYRTVIQASTYLAEHEEEPEE